LVSLRNELAQLRTAAPTKVEQPVQPAHVVSPPSSVPAAIPVASSPPLVKQPALWFAVAGWGMAIVLLFRRKTI
jgi:hypothetical protein